jgi:transposase-like protein
MTITLELFQKAVAERRRERKHGARKYEQELVAFAVAHAHGAVEQGRSVHDAAKELGVTMSTLQSWQRREPMISLPRRLRKVVVAEAQPSAAAACISKTTLTLTTSQGHVVRGLSIEQIIALLQVLS